MYFSQAGEDQFLNDNIFKNKKNGVYIELGALDGVLYSNTKFFEDSLKWNGILIEPHPYKYKMLKKNRPNNFTVNALVSNEAYPINYRFFVDHHAAVSGVETSLSTHHMDEYFNKFRNILKQYVIKIVPVSLTEIIKKSKLPSIDLLSLDVEGHEYEVLLSWDFSVPIHVILIEMLGVQPEKDEKCRQLLLGKNYDFYSSYKLNEIYILNPNKNII